MKFTFNLGNVTFNNERNNWSDKRGDMNHYHYEPARSFELKDLNLEVEFGVEEMLQIVKSDEAIVGQLISVVKNLAPMLVQMKKEKAEKEVENLRKQIVDLESQLASARNCKSYIKERYNDLVKESTSAKSSDRELY